MIGLFVSAINNCKGHEGRRYTRGEQSIAHCIISMVQKVLQDIRRLGKWLRKYPRQRRDWWRVVMYMGLELPEARVYCTGL